MFNERDKFNLFVKGMGQAVTEQVLRETVADACLKGGNTLRKLMDSYAVFLKSGEFNRNMLDFEEQLAEFFVPSFLKNAAVYESVRLAQFDQEAAAEVLDNFNILQHIRETIGKDNVFTVFQDGIKQAHSWLN
jgi:hypothetical protein